MVAVQASPGTLHQKDSTAWHDSAAGEPGQANRAARTDPERSHPAPERAGVEAAEAP